jgi:Holliday junction resolvase RusA-like endonuclease
MMDQDQSFEILLDITPPNSTAQTKRLNRRTGRMFHTPEHQHDMAVLTLLMSTNPMRPRKPLDGPVELIIDGYWPHLKSTAKRDLMATVPKMTKPDLDNWAKGVVDCLVSAGYLASDQIVWRLTVSKSHAQQPRIVITGKVSGT